MQARGIPWIPTNATYSHNYRGYMILRNTACTAAMLIPTATHKKATSLYFKGNSNLDRDHKQITAVCCCYAGTKKATGPFHELSVSDNTERNAFYIL